MRHAIPYPFPDSEERTIESLLSDMRRYVRFNPQEATRIFQALYNVAVADSNIELQKQLFSDAADLGLYLPCPEPLSTYSYSGAANDDNRLPPAEDPLWDASKDGVFLPNFNPCEIAKVLRSEVDSPRLSGYPFWFVSWKVFSELRWLSSAATQKDYLEWVNLHWNCGWTKDHQFKFSYINKDFKTLSISEWPQIDTVQDLGPDYYKLATDMKARFTDTVNGGKLIDRSRFIMPGQQRVNWGK